jgi:hypothetical protein
LAISFAWRGEDGDSARLEHLALFEKMEALRRRLAIENDDAKTSAGQITQNGGIAEARAVGRL